MCVPTRLTPFERREGETVGHSRSAHKRGNRGHTHAEEKFDNQVSVPLLLLYRPSSITAVE